MARVVSPSSIHSGPLPGLALCGGIALAATGLGHVQGAFAGRIWVDALVLAILLGTTLRAFWRPSASFRPGILLSGKTALEIAIVLIGANISAGAISTAGPGLVLGIAAVVALALALSYAIGRALGLGPRLALLIACGNSICGNSAIAAIAPVIRAQARDVATAIAFTAVLGVAVIMLLPILALAWQMDEQRFGMLAGLTVYAVPQVLAATAPISSVSAQVGTFVKLIRVLMLGPLVLAITLMQPRASQAGWGAITHLVPWFILGFLAAMALRSFDLIPETWLPAITATANVLTLMAMAALGLEADVRDIASAGPRVAAAVILSLAALGALALGLIWVLSPA